MTTIEVGEDGNRHSVGDSECKHGWCDGGHSFPASCTGYFGDSDCDGLVHAEFGDESSEGDYWLYVKCDICGREL